MLMAMLIPSSGAVLVDLELRVVTGCDGRRKFAWLVPGRTVILFAGGERTTGDFPTRDLRLALQAVLAETRNL
jgi:hypothetical protein